MALTHEEETLGLAETDPQTARDYANAERLPAAYARVRARTAVMSKDEVRKVWLDVGNMVQTILGALPGIYEHRAALARVLDFDMEHLDNLEDYAYALAHLHSQNRQIREKPKLTQIEDLVRARELLAGHAGALALSGLFSKERVEGLTRGRSYQELGYDVIGLTDLFLERWAEFENNIILSRDQLIRAKGVATELLSFLGERAKNASRKSEIALERSRVYTLVYEAYTELRAALAYVRRKEGDADEIAPSLREGVGGRAPAAGREAANQAAAAPGAAVDDDADDVAEEEAELDQVVSLVTGTGAKRPSGVVPAPTAGTGETRVGFPGASPVMSDPDVAAG